MADMRTLIRVVESAGSRHVSAAEVVALVRRLHSRPHDLSEGDLINRICRFRTYRLERLPLSSLNLDEFVVLDDLVIDYAGRDSAAPPIIYDPLAASIIDGTHRANAAAMRGETTIMAYVGAESDPAWSEDEEEEG